MTTYVVQLGTRAQHFISFKEMALRFNGRMIARGIYEIEVEGFDPTSTFEAVGAKIEKRSAR